MVAGVLCLKWWPCVGLLGIGCVGVRAAAMMRVRAAPMYFWGAVPTCGKAPGLQAALLLCCSCSHVRCQQNPW